VGLLTPDLTVYEDYILFALIFWGLIFGFIFGWNIHDENTRVIIAQEPPTKAPDPEAFE